MKQITNEKEKRNERYNMFYISPKMVVDKEIVFRVRWHNGEDTRSSLF